MCLLVGGAGVVDLEVDADGIAYEQRLVDALDDRCTPQCVLRLYA